MTDTKQENVAQTVRKLMEDNGDYSVISPNEDFFSGITNPFLISSPQNRRVDDLTSKVHAAAQTLKPFRRKGTAQLATLQGLVDWANRFKGDTSVLYADPSPTTPKLTCIANYHGAGGATLDGMTADPTAQHGDHRGVYAFPVSKAWKRWMAVSGEPLDKAQMGQFIEDNAKDFMDPSPRLLGQKSDGEPEPWEQRLIEVGAKINERFGQYIRLTQMSRAFEVHEASNLVATRNPNTGEQSISFVNEHRDAEGQPIQIPGLFLIAIPVFESGAVYRLPIRFQYRKSGAAVKFILTVYDPQRAFDDAFDEAVTIATNGTDLPCFIGTPEA